MKLAAVRNAALVTLAAGLFFVTGCSSENSCSLTPQINQAPASCTLPPSTTVEVDVRWCNCGSSVVCDVTFEGGSYLLEPRVTACDAECPGNPSSCDLDSTVSCVFTTQPFATGGDNSYGVQIVDGSQIRNATFNVVASGGDDTCGP